MPGEIWRRPIGIKMREAHGAGAFPAGDLADSAQRGLLDPRLEVHVALPRDAAFRGIAHHAARNGMLAQIRAAQELVAPVSGSASAMRILQRQRIAIPRAAMVPADLERAIHP